MKYLLFLCFGIISISTYSQESFKKRYWIKPKLDFKYKKFDDQNEGQVTLSKETYVKYDSLNSTEKAHIDSIISEVANNIKYSVELFDEKGKKFTITEKEANSPDLRKIVAHMRETQPDFYSNGETANYKGNVLFEKNKIYVNIWNFKNDKFKDDESILFYKLKDGQTAKLCFAEITATALTIPFKYRPKDGDNEEIQNVFSTSFNAGFFVGPSLGYTKFHHRKKIGNKAITHKYSIGGFIGPASETINENNTSGATELSGGKSQTIGLLSTGLGFVYSRNKISIGFFMGWDKGVGSLSEKWHYDGLLWLGAGIGYDIFKL